MNRIAFLLLILLAASPLSWGQFVFEKELVEVHAPEEADSVEAVFSFEVKGDKPLEIERMDVFCSCLKGQLKKLKWNPGEKGQLKATFSKIGMFKGTVDKKLALFLKGDEDGQPSVSLTFRLHIPVLMEISQKTLRWDVKGSNDEKSVDFIVKGEEPMQVIKHQATKEIFSYQLETVEEGRHYRIRVSPQSTEGPAYGIIRLETDCPIPRHAKHQIFCVIAPAKSS